MDKMYLQDCFRDRNHPEVHQAVRSLLKKMNIEVIEMKIIKTILFFVEHSTMKQKI